MSAHRAVARQIEKRITDPKRSELKGRGQERAGDCELVWPSGQALSPFLIGRMFLREPSWKYSAKLVGS